MLEDSKRCYDPGYAAGATLRRAGTLQTETVCEQGLVLRLESWSTHHFARIADVSAQYRTACRDHFRRGFRDGYWGRARRRENTLELVA